MAHLKVFAAAAVCGLLAYAAMFALMALFHALGIGG